MIRRIIIFIHFFTLIGLINVVNAAQVSENEAGNIAATFFGNTTVSAIPNATLVGKAPKLKMNMPTSEMAYYIFNNTEIDGGWVIVSGDDRTQAILAYSNNGSFNPNDVDEPTRWWLDMYSSIIGNLDTPTPDATPDNYTVNLLAINKNKISPLLTCEWGQNAPFYFQSPQASGKYCVTGCVATAMAQLMYYYKWPKTSKAIPAYTPTGLPEQEALPATTFNWSLMKNYYSNDETSTGNTANAEVAKLLRYCGQSMQMNYGTASSGTTTTPDGLVQYFGYHPKATIIGRTEYSADTWEDAIYAELASGRPVIFSASKATGGHAFICDGYDGNGLYHINWGWYGNYNGYFALNVLNSNGGGTGSIDGADGYVCKLKALIGLEPLTSGSSSMNGAVLTTHGTLSLSGATTASISRSSTSNNFVLPITGQFWNSSRFAETFDIGWGLYNGDELISTSYTTNFTNLSFNASVYKTITYSASFGSYVAPGTYYLKQIFRPSGTSIWKPLVGSGANYIKVQISGNSCTATVVTPDVGSLSFAGVTYTGRKEVGHPIEVKVKVKNNSNCDFQTLYMKVNNVLTGANSAVIPTGKTATIDIHFIPSSAGSKSITFYTDADCNNSLYTSNMTILTNPEANITATPTVSYLKNGVLVNKSATVNIALQNNASTNYNNDIIVYLYKQRENNGLYYMEYGKTIACAVGANSLTTYNTTFSDFENNTRYLFLVKYYSGGVLVQGGQSGTFLVNNTPMTIGDVNNDSEINVGDVSELYKVILGTDLTNSSRANVNGDTEVNTGDISALYQIILSGK